MSRATLKLASKLYLMLMLLSAALLCPLCYSVIASLLLAANLYSFFRPIKAQLDLPLTFGTCILAPLTLEPVAGWLISAMLVTLAIPLVDFSLRENVKSEFSWGLTGERGATTTLKALGDSLLFVLASSLVFGKSALLLTSILLIAYLATILTYVLLQSRGMMLEESWERVSVIAGNTAGAVVSIAKRTSMPFKLLLRVPHPWVHLTPYELEMREGEARVNVTMTPPLAGPSKLELSALILDPWGLVWRTQILEPVELYVIPRARYAQWLARKYLEQSAPGTSATVTLAPSRTLMGARGGVEYYGSRLYEPGDSLKDLDWKHTLKFREIVVKEHIEARGQGVIMLVNLVARDAEGGDRLASSLITSALTFAREGVPTALAAYDEREVVAATPMEPPRETLNEVLKLAGRIILLEPAERFLQPADIHQLRRTMGQLEGAKSEPAKKLMSILQTEYHALEEAAATHPASRALARVAAHTPPPATIMMISSDGDAEALLVTRDRLQKRGYSVLPMGSTVMMGYVHPKGHPFIGAAR